MLLAKNNKLLYNFFSLGAVQAISSLIQLLVIPFVINRIGVDGYGVIAVAQVVMFYLAAFTDYSFNQTATREITLYKADKVKMSQIFSRVIFSKIVLCLIAFIVLLLLVIGVPVFRAHFFLYCMAFTFVVGQSLLINWFFQGLERMYFIALATLVARILFAILVFLFIKGKEDDYLFLFFLGTGNIIAGVISIVVAFRIYQLKFIKPSLADIRSELREGWQITFSHLSNSTCQYANIFILRFFASDLVVGYYAVAERIFFTGRQVFVIFSQAVYPKVCQLLQEGTGEVIRFLKTLYTGFLIVVILGSLLVFIFTPQLLYFFMGHEYHHAIFFLRVFCIVAIIVCLNIPATLLLLAMNQKKSYFRIYASATVINILLNLILARSLEATGTVITIFITEFFITIGLTRIIYRQQITKGKIISESLKGDNY